MRLLAWSLMAVCALAIGCNKPAETIPSVAPSSSGTTTGEDHSDHDHSDGDHDHADDSASTAEGAVRFVADKSISVPDMMCPYACFPAVKEALVMVPGVEGVQLAEQPAGTPEGTIEKRVVELKLAEGFDLDTAVAALKEANYEAQPVN